MKPRQPRNAGANSGRQKAWEMRVDTYLNGVASPQRGVFVHMEIGETLYALTREDFRAWLMENHQSKKEIWLVQYKKVTKKPSIDYVEAVEEAICFGWIDGFEKGMEAERYATRFTPRRPKSNWTETNRERARKMIAAGRMTESGLAALPPDL